jgi:drug/metabolite transporter (DMT)-like permease
VTLVDKGLIFALFAGIGFAVSVVLVRKAAAQAGESFTAAAISAFMGVPFFAVALFFTGEWDKLWFVSGRALILLGVAGVIHFVVGRLLGYSSYRLIGANKATPFIMTNPFYTVIFGILFLKEPLTVYLVLGVLCIFAGAALITTERKSVSGEKQKGFFRPEFKGILAALGAAICWGTTPVLIKPAIAEVGSPFAGAFVSYAVGSIVMAFFFFRRQYREQMVKLPLLTILIPLVLGGLFSSTGQLFNYTALSYSPASVVSSLIGTHIFFILLFSFLLNRNIEIFTLKVILGTVVTVVGTFLLFR